MANELALDLSQDIPNALTAIGDAERAKLIKSWSEKSENWILNKFKIGVFSIKLGSNKIDNAGSKFQGQKLQKSFL